MINTDHQLPGYLGSLPFCLNMQIHSLPAAPMPMARMSILTILNYIKKKLSHLHRNVANPLRNHAQNYHKSLVKTIPQWQVHGLGFTMATLHSHLDPPSSRNKLLITLPQHCNIVLLSLNFIGIYGILGGSKMSKVDTFSARPHASDLLPVLDGRGGRVPRHRRSPVFRVERLRLVASARRRAQLASKYRWEGMWGSVVTQQYYMYICICNYMFIYSYIYIYVHV